MTGVYYSQLFTSIHNIIIFFLSLSFHSILFFLHVSPLTPSLCHPFPSQVPLVVFKREKGIARLLEFEGLYITEQPADDDITGQWDRLVINTP